MIKPGSRTRLSISYRGPAKGPSYEVWREEVCRSFCRLDSGPADSQHIDCRNEFALVDSISLATPTGSSARFARTRDLLTDGCDDVVSIFVRQGQVSVRQGQKTVDLSAGQICLTEMNICGEVALTDAGSFTTTRIPRRALMRVAPQAEALLAKSLSGSAAVTTMFERYFTLCNDVAQDLDAVGQKAAAEHLVDLLGLVLAAAGDQEDRLSRNRFSAARLDLMKQDVLRNIDKGALSINTVAKANGMSARQAQRLFAESGVTFTDFVLEHRLLYARKLLLTAGGKQKVSEIAFAAGFGDLSYFNRCFRKRFGATPTEVFLDDAASVDGTVLLR